jgi:putative ABC transport system substrate-binding protein
MNIRVASLLIAVWGLSATNLCAQDRSKVARIGVLVSGSEATSGFLLEGLRQGLTQQALIEGKTFQLEVRYAAGQIDRLHSIAIDLVKSGVDLIFTGGDQGAWAAKRATDKVPIVAATCDALAAGLVTNLSRPGGNLTGVTCINSDLSGKRVELLKETIPSLSRLGVVLDPDDKRMTAELTQAERAATASSISVHPLVVRKSDEIEPAFAKAASDGMEGVVVVFDAMTFFHRAKLSEIAIRNRVATIFNFRQYVEAGGLLSFGPNLRDMWRQSARHIQKVLKGETPGEIPMEQPTRFPRRRSDRVKRREFIGMLGGAARLGRSRRGRNSAN